MGNFVQVALTAATLGAAYSLMGAGLTLAWGGLRFPNLAHGALYVFGGFMSYWLAVTNGLSPWIGLVLGFILTAAAGALLYVGLFARLGRQQNSVSSTLVAGLGVAIALQAWFTIESPRDQLLPPLIRGIVTLPGGVPARVESFFVIGFSVLLLGSLAVLLTRSSIGIQVRAVAENREAADISGLQSQALFTLIMAVSAGLAGLAGVMLGSVYGVSASGGFTALIMALIVTIVGGLGSVGGSVVAAYTVGISQSATTFWLGSEWVLPILFGALMLFLVARPQGLAGRLTFDPGR